MTKNLALSLLLDFYGGLLTEKQRSVTALYYEEDLSLAEIAEDQGISRQGVRDTVKRAEQQMLEMEETLGLARRFRRITDGLAQIIGEAQVLTEHEDQAVRLCAQRIVALAEELNMTESNE